jgi:hypothetical protein
MRIPKRKPDVEVHLIDDGSSLLKQLRVARVEQGIWIWFEYSTKLRCMAPRRPFTCERSEEDPRIIIFRQWGTRSMREIRAAAEMKRRAKKFSAKESAKIAADMGLGYV